MDQHHKLLRADEEIARLNLEIPRLITYMGGRGAVSRPPRGTAAGGGELGAGASTEQGRGLHSIALPGREHRKERRVPEAVPSGSEDVEMQEPPQYAASCLPLPDEGDEDDEDADADADVDGEAITNAFEAIVRITHDGPAPAPAL
ncbi:hypothetical protein B0H14DRAFT_2593070 [Mycena olivaceomarginata]|nr:hypothetical protein B0H14DRAFT_2593070 [Mycena olivaceomarginata]